jgi:hypothetical protein
MNNSPVKPHRCNAHLEDFIQVSCPSQTSLMMKSLFMSDSQLVKQCWNAFWACQKSVPGFTSVPDPPHDQQPRAPTHCPTLMHSSPSAPLREGTKSSRILRVLFGCCVSSGECGSCRRSTSIKSCSCSDLARGCPVVHVQHSPAFKLSVV